MDVRGVDVRGVDVRGVDVRGAGKPAADGPSAGLRSGSGRGRAGRCPCGGAARGGLAVKRDAPAGASLSVSGSSDDLANPFLASYSSITFFFSYNIDGSKPAFSSSSANIASVPNDFPSRSLGPGNDNGSDNDSFADSAS
ncbi:hypothetical protein [Paenibacillus lentus]|uniref:hypothetical protein n=1 Tax=Paenibacillus lentus TaxID=1338368 RepID=UPI0013DDD08B|nr:hypothetical protein [Paenibacillus lentus]